MKRTVARCSLLAWLAIMLAPMCMGDIVYVGTFSYNTFIPGSPDSAGVNSFGVANLTGDPSSGGFALPPDFPVSTMLRFLDSRLSVVMDGMTEEFLLGDIDPGFFDSSLLYFPETTQVSSARFTARLSSLTFGLSDGSPFRADSDLLDVILSPSGGDGLRPDFDSRLIDVSGAVVPEPSQMVPLALMFTALSVFALKRKRPEQAGRSLEDQRKR